jgi:hypothetical protein
METRRRPVLQRFLIAATIVLVLVPAIVVFADALPQIDVHARRKIEKSVDSYLFEIAHASPGANGQPMMRWTVPICPMVSGFPHGLGQAVFDHFTDVIDSLGRPRGHEGCKPNFFIITTFHPEARLREWWHAHPAAFSYRIEETEKFLSTANPVRVWYCNSGVNMDGTGSLDSGMVLDRVFAGVPTYVSHDNGRSIRSEFQVVPELKSVIVILDSDKIDGFETKQLSEYIAMVGLSKVNMDVSYGDTPTILSLFSTPVRERPQTLSDWDRSFLRALYQTDEASRSQHSTIVNHMVADLTH